MGVEVSATQSSLRGARSEQRRTLERRRGVAVTVYIWQKKEVEEVLAGQDMCILRIRRLWASLVTQTVKNLPAMQETQVWYLGQEDRLEKEWLPIPVFLPGEFHRQRSLAGYSPRGCKELDMTSTFTFSWLCHEPGCSEWSGKEA